LPLSILDLATVGHGEDARHGLEGSVALARLAEACGYRRVWYAEHHNMPRIASSAPSVLIAHVANHTSTIRLGSGGVMLPNHAPLTIAEQFGTLAELHPGRIDLGVGRAPGTDQVTFRALRRDLHAADGFPLDVQELRGYLRGRSLVPGVEATPGKGTNVPIYVLGSSLYGAQVAAALGLPYAFASHFAPHALHDAIALYRREFQASEEFDRPYVMAAANVIAADTDDDAQRQFHDRQRTLVRAFLGRNRTYTDAEAEQLLESPQGQLVVQNFRYTAVGVPSTVRDFLVAFAAETTADELIVAHQANRLEDRLRSVALTAEVLDLSPAYDGAPTGT
jgi:luciferase family oxidoreductase group 1